ncbi:MAG: hypothetical protein WCK51_05065 [Armatimonadota bacterium]
MNPNNIQNEVEHLRAEMPREGAKGELIYSLRNQKGQKMNTLRKATLPTLVTAVALVGGVMLMQPKAVAATPSRVAAALRQAMNYTIQSFVGEGSERRMQSVTTVEGDKKTTKFVDSKGNLVDRDVFMKVNAGYPKDKNGVFQVIGSGNMPEGAMGGGLIDGPAPKDGKLVGGKVEINLSKVNGREIKSIKVNGKEVKDLPQDLKDKLNLTMGKGGVSGVSVNGERPKDAKVTRSNQAMVVASLGTKNGKPMILQSGQTPSEYLMDLLQEENRWNISRGVSYKGEKLDKFGLKVRGDFTPVELYVDPSSALPKYLVFKGMDGMGVKIEDVYTYGARP